MSEWLHHWLEPVTGLAHEVQAEHLGEYSHYAPFGGGEFTWALISTVLAGHCGVGEFTRGRRAWNVRPATEEG